MNVFIEAAATTKFGELWGISPRDLVREVVGEVFKQSGTDKKSIDAIIIGNMLSGALAGQQHLGSFFAAQINLSCAAIRVEGACASGGLAIHTAVAAIKSGMYEKVLVIGIEKMSDYKPEEVALALMAAGADSERIAGATFPGLYAMIARSHMNEFGTKEEDLALVAVKNHFHASLNSHAHITAPVTVEKVLKSPVVASPLKLLDCSPISDGAAAVLLTKNKKSVRIVASEVATDTLGLSDRESLSTLKSTVQASQNAYKKAGLGPQNIDVAEVHDCFTIAEILAMEDLGFWKKGEAVYALRKEQTTIGKGKPVINTSGGLKASGHPVGATGVKQIVEIYQQLTGTAGKKQVKGAKIGLTHNVGGSGGTAVIHILKSLK